jgi:tetratricopeptide (TPR) repeat protein
MDTDRSSRLAAIAAKAREIPSAERQAFLSSACGDDAVLRAEVLSILDSDEVTLSDLYAARNAFLLAPGDQLGDRFRIARVVGRGGMGEVYEAQDLELGGSVAVKLLRSEFADNPKFLARFHREIQLARQVTHTNLCRVFDVGYDGHGAARRVFLSMEFLAGETLWERIRRVGKLDPESALQLVRQMAAGLGALHEHGILHRDFKLGNVMVVAGPGGAERVVICDFGVARTVEPSEPHTGPAATHHAVGTPGYMSPEQRGGGTLTAATDIFALGVVMQQMLTGTLEPIQTPAPLPFPWSDVIGRCLSVRAEDRPQTAAAVVAALEPHQARTRGKRIAVAAAVAALAGVSGALLIVNQRSPAGTGEPHLAVLPLQVMGDDPALRVFSDGLTEALTTRLAQFESGNKPLIVAAAGDVRAHNVLTPAEARRKLHANAAVQGSVEAHGNRLKLVLKVVDTGTGKVMHTIPLDDERSNSWRVQDAAAARLARSMDWRLQTKYAKGEPGRQPADPAAYEFYLQARGYLQREDKSESVANAIRLFRRSAEIDPKFAAAHSGLGQAYFALYRLDHDPKSMEAALQNARFAVTLNSNLAETNIALGMIQSGTGLFAEARERFAKAIALDPGSSEAYQGLARAYLGLKDYAHAEESYRKAIEMGPGDWTAYKALGFYYYQREEFDKAAPQFQKVVELMPDSAQGYLNLGAAYGAAQNWTAAERAWLRVLELDPKNPGALSNLGKVYLDERNEPGKAADMYRRSLAINPRNYRGWGQLGRAYAQSGQKEQSREAFTKALDAIDAELLIDSSNALTFSSLGVYRAYLGRPDFAVAVERALRMAPNSAEVMERAAMAYAVAGEKQRAAEYVSKALQRGYSERSIARNEYLKDLRPGLQARK